MTIKDFRIMIMKELTERLGSGYIVTEHDVDKINRRACQGISVVEIGNTISPVIYMEDFFEAYKEGCSTVEDIINNILVLVYEAESKPRLSREDIEKFMDWDFIKDRVKAKLIPMDKNVSYLADKAYVPFLNLAVAFYIDILEMKDGQASIAITKDMVDCYGITLDELYEQAKENMRDDFQIAPMGLFLFDFLEEGMEGKFPVAFDPDDSEPMYLLCCKSKTHGAVRITDEEIRSQICHYFRDHDLYVLPSSQHELILIPAINGIEAGELLKMVVEVNQTQVAEEDILADNVYMLNSRTNEISIAA